MDAFYRRAKASLFLICGLVATFAFDARAYENRCVTRSSAQARPSICAGGRTIGSDRTRNFRRQQLECTSNADYYLRRPQRFNYIDWSNFRSTPSGKQEAFEMRQKLPDIKWSGEIPYQTVETWQWEECSLGTDSFQCGSDRKCTTTRVPRQSCTTTGSGSKQKTSCQTVTENVRTCVDEPRTCWFDVSHSESWPCSAERMKFSAAYARPDKTWNPSTSEFAEFIPNKYDLFPGEKEVVQVYNGSGQSTTLQPRVAVGEAWNKYEFDVRGSGVGAVCRQNSDYSIDVRIRTIARDTSRPSPNAFVIARDWEGHKMDPLIWANGVREGRSIEHGTPIKLRLADSSAVVVADLAEHSRNTSAREEIKLSAGKTGNPDAARRGEAQDVDSGFFKSTQVRVQLYKLNGLWFDFYESELISNDVKSVKASDGFMSDDQDIKLSDLWEIDLQDPGRDLYEGGSSGLHGGRVYELRVSMYQSGVPFYNQSCADQPMRVLGKTWLCRQLRGSVFSSPVSLRFNTDPNWDTRSGGRRFLDGVLFPFEWIGYKRPTAEGGR